jgi:hypothetical protein
MISPQFPFKEKQIIVTSDRVTIHSKSDAIFLFGKGAVSLSSPQTVNIDANEKMLVYSPKIYLGNEAELKGDSVVKGRELTAILNNLLTSINQAGVLLAQCSDSDPGSSMQAIAAAGASLATESQRLMFVLGMTPETNPIMSNVTFTR